MGFTTVTFLFIFLPLVLCLYGIAPSRFKNSLLLIASLLFYSWGEGVYLLVLVGSIAFNYLIARRMDGRGRSAGAWFGFGIVCNLALLVAFKYAAFLIGLANGLLTALHLPVCPVPDVHLPLGISFFTFEVISYLFGIHRGVHHAEKNPVRFALFVSLFPHLIAGPIIRYETVAAQFDRQAVDGDRAATGLRRFIAGLGKKVLIADALGRVADPIFAMPVESLDSPRIWLAVVCFSLQIFYDFSGYSDMAIGLARVFGFNLPENFRDPYAARSIREFWQRWHISLSTWFRDYLYIPLGGSRCGPTRTVLNLMTVFFLCGLWHGASWNFALWGILHGCFMGAQKWFGRAGNAAASWAGRAWTLLALAFSWTLFRAQDLPRTWAYWKLLVFPKFGTSAADVAVAHARIHPDTALALGVGILLCVPGGRWRKIADTDAFRLVLLILCFASVAAHVYRPFIYFRF